MARFSARRIATNKMLLGRNWFQKTDSDIAETIFNLPETCNGFLEDLALREDKIGPWQLINISEIFIPFNEHAWNIYVVFAVKIKDSRIHHYQYHSWQQGPASGVKGIVLIKNEPSNKFTHIILLQGFKMGAGIITHDCIGGFAEEGEENEYGIMQRFRTELKEELGLQTLPPHQIIPLGRFHPDAGITNNRPFLMAAIISSEYLPIIKLANLPNPDTLETVTKIIIRISELADFIENCEDSFFHVCLTRLLARNIVLFPESLSNYSSHR